MRINSLLLLVPFLLHAAPPSFMDPVIIQADGSDLNVGLISDPFMVDWDGDDLNDLLVGQFVSGKVSFYKNIGSNQDPVFTFSNFLQADGSDISVSYG